MKSPPQLIALSQMKTIAIAKPVDAGLAFAGPSKSAESAPNKLFLEKLNMANNKDPPG